MITKFERKGLKGGTDYFCLTDLPGFADVADQSGSYHKNRVHGDWYGDKDHATAVDQVRNGDLSGVEASEELLAQLETQQFVTPVWRNRLDVVGGSPCVPAYLAGHPMNMRRRERVATQQGPLAIIVSLTLSGGIDTATMRKRGATLLALVRLLSASRPVELWTAVCLGGPKHGTHVLTRLETAPLDLARAAHMLTCPAVTRGLGYGICQTMKEGGNWPHANFDRYQATARELYIGAIGTASEVLYVGAAHASDPLVRKPVAWIKETLTQYGGMSAE